MRIHLFLKDVGALTIAGFALGVASLNLILTFYWREPKIRVFGGPQVQIQYRQEAMKLDLRFKVTVANYGRQMDVINWVQAKLASPDSPSSSPVVFGRSDIALEGVTGQVSLPFAIKDNAATELEVGAGQVLGTDAFKSFFELVRSDDQKRAKREMIELSFAAEDSQVRPLRLCFDLTKEIMLSLEKGKQHLFTTDNCPS